MIITKKVEKALNEHLSLELNAKFSYLAVASWCEVEGYEGTAKFFYKQSSEENSHFMKFFTYINEVGGHALVPALKEPKYQFKSIQEAVEMALEHEQKLMAHLLDSCKEGVICIVINALIVDINCLRGVLKIK